MISGEDDYLGLDLGGTGVKAAVFDGNGMMRGFARRTCRAVTPQPGWAELPVADLHAAVRASVREAVALAGRIPRAMAISSQGQSFVALDAADRPLFPALLWYDSRGMEYASRLEGLFAESGAGIRHVAPFATIAKIMWLKEHCPEAAARVRRYLLLPDFFAYLLTGHAVTDVNTAGSSGLCSRGAHDFDLPALAVCGIERTQLPLVAWPGRVAGPLRAEIAADWGLGPETSLVVGTNDQYAGALGAGNCRPGIMSVAFGTCLALLTLADRAPACLPPGIFSGSFPIRAYRYILTFAKTSGVALDWFRAELGDDLSFERLNALADASPPGSHGLAVCPHFDGQVSPVPDPGLAGAFFNLTMEHTRADMYRALLESLSFCMRENLEYMRQHGCEPAVLRAIGGGAANDVWMQMQADVTGMDVERPAVSESAALGAAMLAMAGVNRSANVAAISARLYRSARVFRPDLSNRAAYRRAYDRYLHYTRLLRGMASKPIGMTHD